ncbi:hypothetical protein Hanom_Chr05g00445271 [Helianthus anomalus]
MLTIREASSINDTVQDDEGFNWSKYIPNEDKRVFVAEIKERTKEEILQEKTYRERYFANSRIQEMQEEYEDARNPVVDKREVVYNDVLAVIPLSGEFYSKKASDKDYLKKMDKIITGVMIASVKQREEEKMKKSVEKLLEELKETTKKEDMAEDESQKTTYESLKKKEEELGEEKQEKVDVKSRLVKLMLVKLLLRNNRKRKLIRRRRHRQSRYQLLRKIFQLNLLKF